MLTPQEVAQRSFAKASFGGYNMAMVDDFLDELTADYEALYKDNTLLKKKVADYVTKLREYQSTEEGMRKALLAAQEMSNKMVQETEAKCAQMLADAESRSADIQRQISSDLSGEEQKLAAARRSLEEYKAQIRAACQKQLAFLDQLDAIMPPPDPQPSRVEEAAEEIQAAVERSVAQEQPGRRLADSEPVEDPSDDPSDSPLDPPPRHMAPPEVVEESSISLYEKLMAERRGETPPTDPPEPPQGKSLEFGKDIPMD